jgi:hypothetical protein
MRKKKRKKESNHIHIHIHSEEREKKMEMPLCLRGEVLHQDLYVGDQGNAEQTQDTNLNAVDLAQSP